jgi:hypothetical protein
MTRRLALIAASLIAISLPACGQYQKQVDAEFGDQNFKSAVALIELHKVRFGSYPEHLSDIKFTGQWDQIWMSAVKYTKLPDGYELDLVRGRVGTPDLSFPPEFWRGLGVRKSNVKTSGGA